MVSKIIVEKADLEKYGLNSNAIYLFSYDIPSGFRDNGVVSVNYTKDQAKYFQDLRNMLNYQLTMKIGHAANNQFSQWIINENVLDAVNELAQKVRDSLIAHDFADKAEKIQIFPLFTTIEGFQDYESRKEEFYLETVSNQTKILKKALADKLPMLKIQNINWISKNKLAMIKDSKEDLADKTSEKSRYLEICDNIAVLEDLTTKADIYIAEQKELKKIEKETTTA